MNDEILNNLKPYSFFKWFLRISEIPHGSGNEQELIKFIENYAAERNFTYATDALGNVFMKIPASIGFEEQPSILMRAHLDMVCVKDKNIDFDFSKDSLKLKIKNNRLYACGTSLGADNAVGIAAMLAIGDSPDILHPELEFLFTVEEEIGMKGIKKFDFNKIKSCRMINMDCGDSHIIAISSLGNYSAKIEKNFKILNNNDDYKGIILRLSGGLGGHPGLMAQKGRASAGNIEYTARVEHPDRFELNSLTTKTEQ